jgi:EAL domain-containing protein (putative c-di-GMP-specific phosphodiesterase class I)/DNA-binding response OmpR family regulator
MPRTLERFSTMCVLIVDDNAANVALLKALLRDAGLNQVITETDPRRVFGLLPVVNPDLVLLDLQMPHVNGLELLGAITRFAAGSYLPVMVLTADTSADTRNQAFELGARDFLTKPLDIVEVVLRTANLLETRQLHQLLRSPQSAQVTTPSIPQPATGAHDQAEAAGRRVRTVLRDRSIVPFFQPVIDLTSMAMVGQEALARFPSPHPQGPAGWFSDAFASGMGSELEWLAVMNALPMLDTADHDTFLALNMSPATIELIPERNIFPPAICPRIVIELTEHVPIEDYSAIHRALSVLRSHGARLAADDLGSGYAGFRHLVALQPDVVKLDISLIRGIHRSRPQRALASALVAFAHDISAEVIAEGVEEAAEVEVLRDMGIRWAQGYYLGMPAPAR